MSRDPNATWLSVLEDTQQKLGVWTEKGFHIPNGPLVLTEFTERFEQICKKQKIRPVTILSNKFIPTYNNIQNLARRVDKSAPSLQNPSPKEGLESQIWKIVLATIEHGCKHGANASMLVKFLVELNKKVPQLGTDVDRFPDDKQVQQPLQDVYAIFFDSYAELLDMLGQRNYTLNDDLSQDERIKRLIATTSAKIEDARARFDVHISQAASREQRDQQVSAQPTHGKGSASKQKEQRESYNVKYTVVRELGQGSFGFVDEVAEQSTGYRYARKRILFAKVGSQEESKSKVEEEVRIMRNLRHQNIVTLATFTQESDGYSIMISPVAEHDLRTYFKICATKDYLESFTRKIDPWFGCLLDALAFTHKHGIRHRDIKPTNILVKENEVYLCDFGLAKIFTGQDPNNSRGPKPEGTLEYRAPEMLPNMNRGPPADVFSLGCVFSEMLTVRHRQSADDFRESRREKPFRDCLPEVEEWVMQFRNNTHSPLLCNVINKMLDKNPDTRIEAQEALDKVREDRRLFGLK